MSNGRGEAIDPGWTKWTPSAPTSPHWYRVADLERLAGAFLSHDRERKTVRVLRDFLTQFDGLSGTAKRKAVLEAVGLQRASMDRLLLDDRDEFNHDLVGRLLAAMQAATRPIKPKALGPLGKDTIAATFSAWHADPETYRYKMITGDDYGVPWIVEAAMACLPEGRSRQLLCGINWSPALKDPFGLGFQLGDNWCGPPSRSCSWSHLICPRPEFLDRGKSSIAIAFARLHRDQGRGRVRHRRLGEAAPLGDPRPGARAQAPGAHAHPACGQDVPQGCRAAAPAERHRQHERERTAELHAARSVLRDPAGSPAGAGEVARLRLLHRPADRLRERAWRDRRPAARAARQPVPSASADEEIPLSTETVARYGRPFWTFNKLVYIEKAGTQQNLIEVGWAEEHDCAIASVAGFTTRAIKDLLDMLATSTEPLTVFCVHDADAAGTMIYHTLQHETKARGARKIKVVNLGLEPWEGIEMGLEVEPVEGTDRRRAVAPYVAEHDREMAAVAEGPGLQQLELLAPALPDRAERHAARKAYRLAHREDRPLPAAQGRAAADGPASRARQRGARVRSGTS